MKRVYLLLLTMVACSGTSSSSDTAAAGGSRTTDTAVISAPRLGASGSNESADALRLVQEYARRDAAGERLRTSDWFNDAITEPDQEPGYDSFTAIRSYTVTPAARVGDTVKISVVYDVIGSMQQVVDHDTTTGFRLDRHDTTETVIFPVVRSPSGRPKIVSPQIDQHVLAATILAKQTLPPIAPADRRILENASHRSHD